MFSFGDYPLHLTCTFLYRKVAAVSGDARRALALCSRALELAGPDGAGLGEVQRALGEAASGAAVTAIRHCSPAERLMLRAVAAEVKNSILYVQKSSTNGNRGFVNNERHCIVTGGANRLRRDDAVPRAGDGRRAGGAGRARLPRRAARARAHALAGARRLRPARRIEAAAVGAQALGAEAAVEC